MTGVAAAAAAGAAESVDDARATTKRGDWRCVGASEGGRGGAAAAAGELRSADDAGVGAATRDKAEREARIVGFVESEKERREERGRELVRVWKP